MTDKTVLCPICGGRGMYSIQSQNEIVESYCNCWRGWLLFQRNANKEMLVEEVPLSEVEDPWGMQPDGNYRREPRAFFDVVGARIVTDKREVKKGWFQPMLKEFGKGVVVLVKSKTEEGIPIFLLTSDPEPGNSVDKNYILLRPTIQASESNMARAHGGEKPLFAELLDKYGNSIIWVELPQEGGRFIGGKINKHTVLEITAEDAKKIVLPPSARWFQLSEIGEAFTNGDVNEHLSQVLTLERLLMS